PRHAGPAGGVVAGGAQPGVLRPQLPDHRLQPARLRQEHRTISVDAGTASRAGTGGPPRARRRFARRQFRGPQLRSWRGTAARPGRRLAVAGTPTVPLVGPAMPCPLVQQKENTSCKPTKAPVTAVPSASRSKANPAPKASAATAPTATAARL